MVLAIFGRYFKDEKFTEIQHFFNSLEKKKIDFVIYRKYYEDCLRNGLNLQAKIKTFDTHADFISYKFDYLISIGGDGTILSSIEYIRETELPVVGINTGRLGFLAGVSAQNASKAIEDIEKGHYSIDSRTVLQLESNVEIFSGVKFALNDFVIHKKDTASMVTIHTFINGEFLNSYWSDGLIISSPTGSTGYNLSCGGPILYPSSESFVITPISPHNLNVRPIIVSDKNIISFEIEGRSSSFLATLDSRSESINQNVQLAIRKADFKFNLVRMNDENYLSTLRQKLMWGYDNRNFRH
ncbi:MAG: NAD kinase [Bacteroidetes bacterium]|jgi:NAD+ kinase|nr:NAD kinase [Bacteroidota bacterium]